MYACVMTPAMSSSRPTPVYPHCSLCLCGPLSVRVGFRGLFGGRGWYACLLVVFQGVWSRGGVKCKRGFRQLQCHLLHPSLCDQDLSGKFILAPGVWGLLSKEFRCNCTTVSLRVNLTWTYKYQYRETKVINFLFNLLRIKGLYMFRAILAHPQKALHKRHLVYCVRVTSVSAVPQPLRHCEPPPVLLYILLSYCKLSSLKM
jgi:hypothetical protein